MNPYPSSVSEIKLAAAISRRPSLIAPSLLSGARMHACAPTVRQRVREP
jgi:hypothetical protein